MYSRNVGFTLLGAVLLILGTGTVLLAQSDSLPEPFAMVSGELAFSETIVFDYDRDGSQERVQFWIAFEAKLPENELELADPEHVSGSLIYYVYDLDQQKRVDNWMLGFNMTMGGGFPKAGEEYPLSNVSIIGNKAEFDLRSTRFTIVDGGDSWQKDTISITDVNGTRQAHFYGGDVRVNNPLKVGESLNIKENFKCIECHEAAAMTIGQKGGPHQNFVCTDCHTIHPPEVESVVFPNCLGCHEGHSDVMNSSACTTCHGSHDVSIFTHNVTIPDNYCGGCHIEVIETLKASRSLHMGVACVLCHQNEHSAEVKGCQYCHRGSHPVHVMRNPDRCIDCHNSAHNLKSSYQY